MIIKHIEETFPNPGRGVDYAVHFVRLDDGDRGVWKPNMEADTGSIVPLRESLAYQIDKIIGANLVPQTEIHFYDGKWGVLQRFVEGAVEGHKAMNPANANFRDFRFEHMQCLGAFDFICSNPDRGPSNWLVRQDGSLVAIDNGGAFQQRDSFTWSAATIMGRELKPKAKALVERAYNNIETICNAILDIEYKPHDVVITGLEKFDVAAELAVNHTYVLATAIGLTNDRYNMLGLINCRKIGIDIEAMKERALHA